MNCLTLLSLSWQHILIILIIIPLYFIPTYIAFSRKKANTGAIFALNLFLGWALIGWVGALIWALSNEKSNTGSNIDQLTKLKVLHDEGVITDEEFETQKNKLLR
ncbi:superinfection immunity protein [Chryseobacterium taeanense]|uniref:Short C-terminal domain-containing protein n=1 Tax=Chryseobacterium taeanense TaxID=311334 RepID=A0A1G8HQG1_9FLAO|nr:superinfection immunity protein [Chryseobacterium taeanense]SDI08907.1 Short C-terminal domain-containing protein [Chryseobacterium taeanense]